MKFNVIVADPPFSFLDKLSMSKVARSAESNYSVMTNKDILELKINEISEEDAILALWVPSSLLTFGLECMKKWGFRHTQTVNWIKTKKDPFQDLKKQLFSKSKNKLVSLADVDECLQNFDFDTMLAFGMGRIFRNVHEVVLIGVRGKIYSFLKNKSQRTVFFDVNIKHSQKPEILQNRLDLMFPDPNLKRLEIFGRRLRDGWKVLGNESPSDGLDIRESLEKLEKFSEEINENVQKFNEALGQMPSIGEDFVDLS